MVTRKEQQRHCVRAFMRGGKKQVQSVDLASKLPESVRVFSTHTLVPGASIGVHSHPEESELIYVLEGTCRVQDDDKVYFLTAGDSMVSLCGHRHGMENAGDTTLVLVNVVVREKP